MLARWIRHLYWRPFELCCRRLPLVPLRATVTEAAEGVLAIRIENLVTRALSRLAGGYDYAVCYLITRRVFDRRGLVERLSFSDGWLSLLTGSDFSRGNLVKSFLRAGGPPQPAGGPPQPAESPPQPAGGAP